MNELLDHLRQDFKNEDARYGYVEAFLNAFVAAQIKALREQRSLSQDELATAIGTKQSGISRLENVNYSAWKVETLRKLARALGVRLKISFEEFGTLIPEILAFSQESLKRDKFDDDRVFAGFCTDRKPRQEGAEYVAAIRDAEIPRQGATDPLADALDDAEKQKSKLTILQPKRPQGGLGALPSSGGQVDLSRQQQRAVGMKR